LNRNNIGKSVVFLWAEALRDFVDRTPVNDEGKSNSFGRSTQFSLVDAVKTVTTDRVMPEANLSPITSDVRLPPIYSAEPFEDRKSVFQAHLTPVHSKDEVQLVLSKLKENKKIGNATHNMYAYR
jgi:hypothetical protein